MFKLISFGIAAIGLTTACASTPSDQPKGAAKYADDARLGEKVNKICFSRSIDGFSRNDRDTVVVSAIGKKQYLIEVRGLCTNLNHAQSIGIASTLSCVTPGDALLVSQSAFSLNDEIGGPQRCLIKDIYEWNEDAEQISDEAPAEESS